MVTRCADNILLLAGTRDGLYCFDGSRTRDRWIQRGPYLNGCDIGNAVLDPRDGRTIWAAATGNSCTAVYRSRDRGETWEMAGKPFDCEMVWHVEPGHRDHPTRVYAGVRPAALYQSDDFGNTWQPVAGLNNHPSRSEWWEGGGGVMLHTILTDDTNPDDLTVAISVAGVFRSADGGVSWSPHNTGTISMHDVWGEMNGTAAKQLGVHRCVHKIVRHPEQPDVLFQQNHDGVYRSDDRGATWADISDGLRDRFGFVIGITRDASVYVVPQDMHQIRYRGQLAVYRLRDGSATWEALTTGLPEVEGLTLYREGMATDAYTPGGVYFGTNHGDLYHTIDGGETWSRLAGSLPPIRSVSCGHY